MFLLMPFLVVPQGVISRKSDDADCRTKVVGEVVQPVAVILRVQSIWCLFQTITMRRKSMGDVYVVTVAAVFTSRDAVLCS